MNYEKLIDAMLDRGIDEERAIELADWWCYAPKGTPYPDLSKVVICNSAKWEEGKHPRAKDGKFTSGGGTTPRSSHQIRKGLRETEKRLKSPHPFDNVLSDEDKAALRFLDEAKAGSLRYELLGQMSLEKKAREAEKEKQRTAEKAAKEKARGEELLLEREEAEHFATTAKNRKVRLRYRRLLKKIDEELDRLGVE